MTTTLKLISLLFIIAGIVYLAGCSQSPPVYIVGVWAQTGKRQITTTNGAVTQDTTYIMPGTVDTFNADHSYSFYSAFLGFGIKGTFTLDGQTVKLYDNSTLVLTETVTTLTQHALVMQHTDTISYTPFKTIKTIESFIR